MTTRNPGPNLWLMLALCLFCVTVLIPGTTSGPLQAVLTLIVIGLGGYLGGLAIRSQRRNAQTLQHEREVLDGLEPLSRPDQDPSR
ncbi:MAG: hypothetical protein ACRYF3_12190 [Janthinobacterium lividum]